MSDTIKIALTALSSGLVAWLVNYLAFRNKTMELKLSNYYKDRIDAVKTMYGLIVDLSFETTSLFSLKDEDLTHVNYKARLLTWMGVYDSLSLYYSKNRILLLNEDEINRQILNKLNIINKVSTAVFNAYKDINYLEDTYIQGNFNQHYNNDLAEENAYIEKCIDAIKSTFPLAQPSDLFELIRIDLEIYFKKITNT